MDGEGKKSKKKIQLLNYVIFLQTIAPKREFFLATFYLYLALLRYLKKNQIVIF